MTRFKELARIEAAIEQGNRSELRRAEDYCRMRLTIASQQDHQKYWKDMQRKVLTALASEPEGQFDPE